MYRNMKVIIPPFVYDALDHYGNTVISMTRYKKFGEEKILNALKKKGYICSLVILENRIPISHRLDKTCVIELKDKCNAAV